MSRPAGFPLGPARARPLSGRPARLAAALALAAAACGSPGTRDVRVTILDAAGEPIPGAVFYAEAYDEEGPFAFLSAVAGTAGEVPDSARRPLQIPWRPGARIALAAFAPGYRPAVLRDPERRIESDGAVLVLEPAEEGGAWNPALAELGYPFEGSPALAAVASRPRHAALRRAFAAAWEERRASGAELSEAERRKIAALPAE